MGRRANRWLLAVCTFVVADIAAARVLLRLYPQVDLPPPEVEEHQYRVESTLYDHDLAKGFDGFARWGPFRYHIATNSLGFKDSRPRAVPLRPEGQRLLLIGDSFTEGIGLDYNETYAGLIAKQLGSTGTDVLNAAVASYSPAVHYAKLRYLFDDLGLQCTAVVVFVDISDAEDEARLYDLHRDGHITRMIGQTPGRGGDFDDSADEDEHVPPTLAAAGRPRRTVTTPPPLDEGAQKESLAAPPSALVARIRRNSVTARLGFAVAERWHPKPPERAAYPQAGPRRGLWTIDEQDYAAFGRLGLERAAGHMHRLAALLRSHGIPLTVAVYPWPDQIRYDDGDSIQVGYWKDWCARHGARFVNLFPPFFADPDRDATIRRFYFAGDVHLNAEGSRLIASTFLNDRVSMQP